MRAAKIEDGRERYSAAGRPAASGTVRPGKMLLTCLLLLVSVFGLGTASAQAPMGDTGSLSASVTSAASSNNLTADGTPTGSANTGAKQLEVHLGGWVHWALNSAATRHAAASK